MIKRKYIAVVLIFLLLHASFYFFFKRETAKKSELIANLKRYKLADSSKTKILFMGDSHVARSISESDFDKAISLAYYGENNVMTYYHLKFLLSNNYPKPRYLVLPCDIVTFSKGYNEYRANKYFYYGLIPVSELKDFEPDKLLCYFSYYKQKLFPYGEWQHAFDLQNTNRKIKGKRKFSDQPAADREKNAHFFLQYELACAADKKNLFCPTAISYLNKMIELCKENNIKLIFIRFPLTKEVFAEIRNNVDSTYILNRPSEDILKNNNIPVLNFERAFEDKPNLFFDCHHLNDSGRIFFSPLIKKKLDSLINVY